MLGNTQSSRDGEDAVHLECRRGCSRPAMIHATLWMAVAADMGTSILVVLNELRALGDG
jgi:hypothetical protein